jgi:hypothetical protein
MGIAFPTYFFFGAVPAPTATQQFAGGAGYQFSGPLSHPAAPPF